MDIGGNQGEDYRWRLLETRGRITEGDCWTIGEDNRWRLLDTMGRITDGDCWKPGGR